MKSTITLFAVSLLFLLSFQILPQETADQSASRKEACFETLQMGLKSDNLGLLAGCVYMLGELCCSRSIIKLMDILHNNPSEELRILAALALYKIRDSRGIFAIKQTIRFDQSERVRRLCEIFYKSYLQEKNSSSINVATK